MNTTCALCEKLSPKTRFAGVYITPGGCRMDYILCRPCAGRMMNADEKERDELLQIIEATLQGGMCG